ncbi:UNVERIFIED_CONTAM: MLP-like protein 28 [Sesamum angustifolium]|uniref:MLP-like protein 28 n=1 Tax=Sesamum angustifolium TaxID=2727405 RepID=A0AAW2MTI4_9LAMI
MGLTGKLVAAIEFKAGGDLFHELFRHKPHHVSTTSPGKVQGCDLHEGEFGHVGSVICWKYTHDGKKKIAKQLIQTINEEKKLIEFKMLEGDLMEEYKNFLITLHIETKDDIDLVTWTLEYEMLNDDVGHPLSLLAFFIDLTKDIESHHINKP